MTAADIVKAHQYLYYVRTQPIWSDYDYDRFCAAHGIEGGGGSDRECDYDPKIVELAERMALAPHEWWPDLTTARLSVST